VQTPLHNLVGLHKRQGGWGAKSRGGRLACPLHCRNGMNGTNELAMDENDNDLFGGWFEDSELASVPEAAPYEEISDRPSRVGMIVAGISATALTLVLIFAGRV
jgi:hypothetical protein